MSEEINKIFEQWKQFLSWCYENNDKTTEIHRDNLKIVMTYTRQLENIIKEVREYITSYESISTIQGLEDIETNKDLDIKTMNEMIRRYMVVHDKLLEILKGSDKE